MEVRPVVSRPTGVAAVPSERALPPPFVLDETGLAIDGVAAEALAARFGTPLYVVAEARVRDNARRFAAVFSRRWPKFRPHFAVKANPNPAVVRILHQEGFGADCASPTEIEIARHAGVPASEILYTAAYPGDAELAFAIERGVSVNLDDPGLLEPLLRYGRPPRLLIRLRPDERRAGPEGLALGGSSSKFGCSLDDAMSGFVRARGAGVRRLGAHAMIGSNLLDPEAFRPAATLLARATARMTRELGEAPDTLDLGGGFGVPYRPEDAALDLDAVASTVADALSSAPGLSGRAEADATPTLVAEPGRYVVADAGVLLARVTHVKPGPPRFVGLDAGMQTLLRPALYGAYHPVYPAGPVPSGSAQPTTVCGPVCEPKDVLAVDRPLPAMNPGDLVAIGIAGAYGFAMASPYNGWPRPGEVLVRGGRAFPIRRRETRSALTRDCIMPRHLVNNARRRIPRK